ncbi:MAG: sortase [Anaerolineaceae bacterium]|nr:sortase [Anaerolineaceae bacterium]
MNTTRKLFSLFSLVVFLFSFMPMQTAHAADQIVTNTNDSGPGSMRQAIIDAGSGETITFADGLSGDTITLVSELILSKSVTIDGSALTSPITISGNSTVRVFYVNSSITVILDNLIISNGQAIDGGGINNHGTLNVNNSTFSGNSATEYGGGIFNRDGALNVDNSTFFGNSATEYGGGICNLGGSSTLDVDNSTFSDNSATEFGGGIYTSATLNVDNSTFSRNSADYGGGIQNRGTMDVDNSTFSDNSATSFGGGIYTYGTASLNKSTFSGNSAGFNGGGIYTWDTLNVNNSTFAGNSATNLRGGGIYNWDGALNVDNSTFSGNSAITGGGICNWEGALNVDNSTFSGNSANNNSGGGIFNNSVATLHYSNTILTNNPTGYDCYNDGGTIGTNNHNLVESQIGCGTPAITADPFLAPLADNGGPTQTMALLPGSVAINAGDNVTCTSTDQRGVIRPQESICDIGAYESGASILTVVSSTPTVNASQTSLTSITVNFNEDALQDSSANAANNSNNYLLVERGENDAFDTQTCAEGLQSDDTSITINTASYDNSTFSSTLTLASELPVGDYRLYVCGTTSIWSAAGLELNNGANDTLINFSIIVPAVLPTTGFSDAAVLPATGFPLGLKTNLPVQPTSKAYSTSEMTLEIPALKVTANIVGVPSVEDTWDVSWLSRNVGWLEGSAAPTWTGNTVLTGHVWDADNQPGGFYNLKSLGYGDQFTIHAWGQTYTYEVRQNKLVSSRNIRSVMQHETLDWVTLLTCESYNPNAQTYPFRRVVRAVLVKVE